MNTVTLREHASEGYMDGTNGHVCAAFIFTSVRGDRRFCWHHSDPWYGRRPHRVYGGQSECAVGRLAVANVLASDGVVICGSKIGVVAVKRRSQAFCEFLGLN